jgi:predicted nuclease of predicted toxin-antitoxin system
MARLYADEQFPRVVSELLRTMGHDVLTVQEAGNANLGIPDEDVPAFAIRDNRAVITLNRQDFARLHRGNSQHFGIIVCTNDTDRLQMATRIDEAISALESLESESIGLPTPKTTSDREMLYSSR